MSTFKIVIPYTPKPKQSVRLVGKRAFNPSARGMKQTTEYVKQVMKDLDISLMTGPLLVIAHFKLPVIQSKRGKLRERMNGLPHVNRPDVDNLEKFLNDCLNGVLWRDDSMISWMLCSKTITSDKVGSTILFIRELNNEPMDYEQLIEDIRENTYKEEVLPEELS